MTVATNEIMEREAHAAAEQSLPLPMHALLYAGDRCVAVALPPHQAPPPGDGVCRCAACRAVAAEDLAALVR